MECVRRRVVLASERVVERAAVVWALCACFRDGGVAGDGVGRLQVDAGRPWARSSLPCSCSWPGACDASDDGVLSGARRGFFAILAILQRQATPKTKASSLQSAWTVRFCRQKSWPPGPWMGLDAKIQPSNSLPQPQAGPHCCTLHTPFHPTTSPPTTACDRRNHGCPFRSSPPVRDHARRASMAPYAARRVLTNGCRCSPSAPCLSASSRRSRTAARGADAAWTHGTEYVDLQPSTGEPLLTRRQQSRTTRHDLMPGI